MKIWVNNSTVYFVLSLYKLKGGLNEGQTEPDSVAYGYAVCRKSMVMREPF